MRGEKGNGAWIRALHDIEEDHWMLSRCNPVAYLDRLDEDPAAVAAVFEQAIAEGRYQ